MGELVRYHEASLRSQELNFASGALSPKEGRALNKTIPKSTLVHEELAKENNWQLRQIKLKNFQKRVVLLCGKEVTIETLNFQRKVIDKSTGSRVTRSEKRLYGITKTSQTLIEKDESNAIKTTMHFYGKRSIKN